MKRTAHRKLTPFRRPLYGFTLVELLVVIAVISVLAGLLLPALEGALVAARRLDCLGRVKQLYLVAGFWSDDHEGRMPFHGSYTVMWNARSPDAWAFIEQDYFQGDLDFFRCPSKAPNSRISDNRWWSNRYWRAGYPSYSFAIGSAVLKDLNDDYWVYESNLTRHEPDMVVFQDLTTHHEPAHSFPWLLQANHWDSAKGGAEGLNAAFQDGHGEWVLNEGGKLHTGGSVHSSELFPATTQILDMYGTRGKHGNWTNHDYWFSDHTFTTPKRGRCWPQ